MRHARDASLSRREASAKPYEPRAATCGRVSMWEAEARRPEPGEHPQRVALCVDRRGRGRWVGRAKYLKGQTSGPEDREEVGIAKERHSAFAGARGLCLTLAELTLL